MCGSASELERGKREAGRGGRGCCLARSAAGAGLQAGLLGHVGSSCKRIQSSVTLSNTQYTAAATRQAINKLQLNHSQKNQYKFENWYKQQVQNKTVQKHWKEFFS